jgi:transposase
MFCGYRHFRVDDGKRLAAGIVYIYGLEGFWSYANERLTKYHGVFKEYFPFNLKELEFRFNNRTKNIFKLINSKYRNFLCQII